MTRMDIEPECVVCGDFNLSKKIQCLHCRKGINCFVCGNCNICIAPAQVFPYAQNVFYILVDTDKDMILSEYQELVNTMNNVNLTGGGEGCEAPVDATSFVNDPFYENLIGKMSNITIHNVRNRNVYEYVDDNSSTIQYIKVFNNKTHVALKNIYGSVLCGKLIAGNTGNATRGITIKGYCKVDECKYVVEIEKKV